MLLCDCCGKEIDHERLGNAESANRESAPVFFLHKECSDSFRQKHPESLLWAEIVSFRLETK